MKRGLGVAALAILALGVAVYLAADRLGSPPDAAEDAFSDPDNWTSFGRTAGEQHFSPLDEIDTDTVSRLGLAWSMDLPVGNSVTAPVAADGVLYFATFYSVVHAVDAATGKLLWTHDPKAAEAAGHKLRSGWGIRGIAYWEGKIYTGTHDGRLLALDAATGKQVWSAMTIDTADARFISGPPRVFNGKVIIGHGGADAGSTRGYVTTYDARTGRQLWRFWTVPGNPADGFENAAMEMAAKTWAGEWWKHGGGGTVWNTMTYDPEFNRVYLGVGNGAPWNRRIRSAGQGDNLFLASIVALDADTGAYAWHYQINPGENWDYNASMDMELATLEIGGKKRKVLMHAPKNGFFYVIDRETGKLISAEPIVPVNWASRIDLETGRPVEIPAARFEDGKFELRPGPVGAHSWLPMSFNPETGLVYIPAIDMSAVYDDEGIDPETWTRLPGLAVDGGVHINLAPAGGAGATSSLLAWDPVAQKQVWRVPTPGFWNGGTMATAGGLVFQGEAEGSFKAYDAATGTLLWTFAAQAPVIAPPISYRAGGRQYVTVLTGNGMSGGGFGPQLEHLAIDYRTQTRRVLTFALDGRETLPAAVPFKLVAADDPDFVPDPDKAARGAAVYGRCIVCHGIDAIAAGLAPDLRGSPVPASAEAFRDIVKGGALVAMGMPAFEEMPDEDLEAMRHYLRTRARELAASRTPS
ncbi:MAG: PQQ-dependent dehydrogenase, methanol/ethanol family [Sphingomonadales bacterium]